MPSWGPALLAAIMLALAVRVLRTQARAVV
jgi:hypothetical protein